MARLNDDFLQRCEDFSQRMVDVAEAIAERPLTRRVCDQIVGCGTSVGANMSEADEAISRKEFVKCLSTVAKELSESKFWLRFVARRDWLAATRLDPLLAETAELRKIVGTMIVRTKTNDRRGDRA